MFDVVLFVVPCVDHCCVVSIAVEGDSWGWLDLSTGTQPRLDPGLPADCWLISWVGVAALSGAASD